jgi:UDP-glucose 4-epimerase
VISASSAAVYGEPAENDLPLVEPAPKAPANPYGTSKLAAESKLADVLSGSGVDWASFRFSNVYGPRQDGAGEGGVVAVFCERMHRGLPLTVFGTGEQTRDFIYVGDVVGAIVAAIDFEGRLGHADGDTAAYNISTCRETSVNDLFSALSAASGYAEAPELEPARAGDVLRSSLDPSKARATFGWSAQQELTHGAEMTWRWYASQA